MDKVMFKEFLKQLFQDGDISIIVDEGKRWDKRYLITQVFIDDEEVYKKYVFEL